MVDKQQRENKLLKILKDTREQQICMCPEPYKITVGNCSGTYSKSHTLSRASHLSFIQENNHVLGFEYDPRKGKILSKPIGWKHASTFSGFCSDHDTKIFKPIDDGGEITSETAFLIAFRSYCMENYKKNVNSNFYTKTLTSKLIEPHDLDFIETAYYNHIGLRDNNHGLNDMEDILLTKEYHRMKHIIIKTKNIVPFLWSAPITPIQDLCGRQIQDIQDDDKIMDFVVFSGVPTPGNGSSIIFSWIEGSPASPREKYGASIKAKTEDYFSKNIVVMVLDKMENVYMRPSWYNSLSEGEKNAIKLFILPLNASKRIQAQQSGLLNTYMQKLQNMSQRNIIIERIYEINI